MIRTFSFENKKFVKKKTDDKLARQSRRSFEIYRDEKDNSVLCNWDRFSD